MLTKYISIGEAAIIAVLALGGWFAFKKIESLDTQMGALKTSNDQLSATVTAKTNATQGRAQVDRDVRGLAPADIINRLQ